MDYMNAINARHSRRAYDGKSLPLETAIILHDLAAEYSKTPGVDIRFVPNNGKAFNGITKSYGVFTGVNNYFFLVRNKDNPKSAVKLGYYGELLILRCTEMGLNTCWVGGAFSKRDLLPFVDENQVIECAITVGHSPKRRTLQENLIHFVFYPRTKRVTDMYESEVPNPPDWFLSGMAAAAKAPSTYNRQPAFFIYHKDGTVSAQAKNVENDTKVGVDLGVAKLHFEIGSGKKFVTDNKVSALK
jgi:nitroreductase